VEGMARGRGATCRARDGESERARGRARGSEGAMTCERRRRQERSSAHPTVARTAHPVPTAQHTCPSRSAAVAKLAHPPRGTHSVEAHGSMRVSNSEECAWYAGARACANAEGKRPHDPSELRPGMNHRLCGIDTFKPPAACCHRHPTRRHPSSRATVARCRPLC
jgi:hypothetical protein